MQNTPKTPAPTTLASTKPANDDAACPPIRRVFEEEFEGQERKINYKIKSNMKLINNHLYKIFADVGSTKSLEFTQSKFDKELKSVKKDVKKITLEMKELTKALYDPNLVSDRFIKLEHRFRKNKLRIDGTTEKKNQKKLGNNPKIKSRN